MKKFIDEIITSWLCVSLAFATIAFMHVMQSVPIIIPERPEVIKEFKQGS